MVSESVWNILIYSQLTILSNDLLHSSIFKVSVSRSVFQTVASCFRCNSCRTLKVMSNQVILCKLCEMLCFQFFMNLSIEFRMALWYTASGPSQIGKIFLCNKSRWKKHSKFQKQIILSSPSQPASLSPTQHMYMF